MRTREHNRGEEHGYRRTDQAKPRREAATVNSTQRQAKTALAATGPWASTERREAPLWLAEAEDEAPLATEDKAEGRSSAMASLADVTASPASLDTLTPVAAAPPSGGGIVGSPAFIVLDEVLEVLVAPAPS
jgi:hypothetical protein